MSQTHPTLQQWEGDRSSIPTLDRPDVEVAEQKYYAIGDHLSCCCCSTTNGELVDRGI